MSNKSGITVNRTKRFFLFLDDFYLVIMHLQSIPSWEKNYFIQVFTFLSQKLFYKNVVLLSWIEQKWRINHEIMKKKDFFAQQKFINLARP